MLRGAGKDRSMSKRVLISGGAGFIGSHVAERLLGRGDQVLVVDNYATARRDSLPAHPKLRIVEGSIAEADLVERVWADFQPEIVIHAAASYKDPTNWAEDTRTNALGTALVVQASERHRVRRLIYFQTALCYGLHPLEQPVTLDHPLRPEASSYAISKTAGEHYVRLSALDHISFRLANMYGPRNLSGPLPTFYQRLTSGKACFVMDTRRDFLFIADMLPVVLEAVDGRGDRGVYHIASGRDFAVKELYEATVKALALRSVGDVEVRPRGLDDAYTILLDPSKTCRDFAWEATTPLEVGVSAAVKWYQRYGISQTFTHLNLPDAKGR
jgi:UDP-glucose 4-epimerase